MRADVFERTSQLLSAAAAGTVPTDAALTFFSSLGALTYLCAHLLCTEHTLETHTLETHAHTA